MANDNRYREWQPSEKLQPYVECFWSVEEGAELPAYPVMPDGCVDIVFTPAGGLQVAGTMTSTRMFAVPEGHRQFGVRFRPGVSESILGVPGSETTDRMIPLPEIWGRPAAVLGEQLDQAESTQECIALLEARLPIPGAPGSMQRICAAIIRERGQSRVDELAFDAGMSARQLRRLFLENIGLSPKHFCRIIRFRDSLFQLAQRPKGDWVQVALDCGFYDQSHFINEFRSLSGFTPAQYLTISR